MTATQVKRLLVAKDLCSFSEPRSELMNRLGKFDEITLALESK